MTLKSTVAKRIFFGTAMTGALAAMLLGEGWLASRNYFFMPKSFRGILFALIAALAGCGGAVELARLARNKGADLPLCLILPAVILISLQPFWPTGQASVALAAILLATLMAQAIYQGTKNGTKDTITNLSGVCFVVIYLGLGCFFLVSLRLLGRPSPSAWGQTSGLIIFLACVKSADIGAYFTGKFLGRHKWVPSISPAKTWEGFFGGIALAIIVASLFAGFSGIMSSGRAIIFGIVIAVTGQMGDLLESMLKRDAGIKDSAALVPEFGGFLDLIDSPMIAAPFGYLLLCL